MIGQTINNYLLERKLGEGSMGKVFLARHNRIDRVVAIKILHKNLFANETIRNRFKNEANALIKLEHPNIVKIFDYLEQDDFACLIVEYIEGITLDGYISKYSGPLPDAKATTILSDVLDAVQYAHENKIFHRDIKPGNIMVSREGRNVKIMDFGIAKFSSNTAAPNVTQINTQLGTPFYMSPEQVKGLTYSASSDIYSLGVTLFEMATGKCPYMGIKTLFELHSKIVSEPLPPTNLYYPDVSLKLQEAIKIATNKIPENRFKSCNEFKSFLQEDEKVERTPAPRKKAKWIYWIIPFLILVMGGLAWFFFFQKNSGSIGANVHEKNKDSVFPSNEIKSQPPTVNRESLISEKADSIILFREKSTNTVLKDQAKRQELKEKLINALSKNTGADTLPTIIDSYHKYFLAAPTGNTSSTAAPFVLPPDKRTVEADLERYKLSNGILYSAATPITNYITSRFDKNNPPSTWSASGTFKRNDTGFQVTVNYQKLGNNYQYNSNLCTIISLPPEPVYDPIPKKATIISDLIRFCTKQKTICGFKFTGEKDISDVNVKQKTVDGYSNIIFAVDFTFKGALFSCNIIYKRMDENNSSKSSYTFFNLNPNCQK
jgi:serine/threonine protein kinase